MNVYIMRHGQTIGNVKRIIQGNRRFKLTKEGADVVGNTAKQCCDISFDVIYSSPVLRAVQTAEIMNEFHHVELIKDIRLTECGEGVFEGRCSLELTKEEMEIQNFRRTGYDMESWQSVYERMVAFVADLCKNKSINNVLVVTHDLPATCLEDVLLNHVVDNTNRCYFKNFNNGEIRCYKIG